MKLIIGLGNPGEKYELTRHNLGFQAVDHFLKDISSAKTSVWSANSKLKSDIASINWSEKENQEKLILAKPTTYMNNSGVAVGLLSAYYRVKPEDVWVVYDELDLPVGSLKIRFGGAAAGHHGVESIMKCLDTDKFWRFRLGIGQSHDKEKAIGRQVFRKADEYVLSKFDKSDQGKVRELLKHATKALIEALSNGIDAAMNKYNTR